MKKCHICGTTRESGTELFQEIDGETYCIFCLDEDGKPRRPNSVRISVLSFWRDRELQHQDSKSQGS